MNCPQNILIVTGKLLRLSDAAFVRTKFEHKGEDTPPKTCPVILWSNLYLSTKEILDSFFVALEPSTGETASVSSVTAIGSSLKQSNTPTIWLVKSGQGNNSFLIDAP